MVSTTPLKLEALGPAHGPCRYTSATDPHSFWRQEGIVRPWCTKCGMLEDWPK